MGLITGLITLPLAPVRGTVWIAEQILDQAERQYYDEGEIQRQLIELETERNAGRLSPEEAERLEDALVERLIEGEARGVGERHG